MKKDNYLKIDSENASEICAKIRNEADEESALLIEKAHKEKERIISEAYKEAQDKRASITAGAEEQIEKIKEKIFSTVNMEKKRIILSEKNKFIDDVISAVKKDAENFRPEKEYQEFLKDAIIEGVDVIDRPDIEIFYSFLDKGIINSSFKKDVESALQSGHNTKFKIDYKESDFKGIGIIMQSKDGRLFFDNRFTARLKRFYEDIYMGLLREAF